MDRTVITMPDDFYSFLLSIPTAQDYLLQLAVGAERNQRSKEYQVTFRMQEQYKFLEPVLRVVKDNVPIFDYSGWREQQRGEYDCFIDMDLERAKRIAVKANLHITMGLNVIAGVGADQLPVLKALQLPKPECDLLIVPWDNGVESEKFYEYMFNNHPDLDIIMDPRHMGEFNPKDVVDYAAAFHIVVGRRSPLTYAAAALKRAVIEIFDTEEDMFLYGQNGVARMYQGTTSTKASYIWSLWRAICPSVVSYITKSRGSVTASAESGSIAKPVEEKSSEPQTR